MTVALALLAGALAVAVLGLGLLARDQHRRLARADLRDLALRTVIQTEGTPELIESAADALTTSEHTWRDAFGLE